MQVPAAVVGADDGHHRARGGRQARLGARPPQEGYTHMRVCERVCVCVGRQAHLGALPPSFPIVSCLLD